MQYSTGGVWPRSLFCGSWLSTHWSCWEAGHVCAGCQEPRGPSSPGAVASSALLPGETQTPFQTTCFPALCNSSEVAVARRGDKLQELGCASPPSHSRCPGSPSG
uniref:Uncharacterized protein n=1 Tax=Varanus komodoensis TaxID=61221 RepID=A0A8D2KTC5_VARKO